MCVCVCLCIYLHICAASKQAHLYEDLIAVGSHNFGASYINFLTNCYTYTRGYEGKSVGVDMKKGILHWFKNGPWHCGMCTTSLYPRLRSQ